MSLIVGGVVGCMVLLDLSSCCFAVWCAAKILLSLAGSETNVSGSVLMEDRLWVIVWPRIVLAILQACLLVLERRRSD